MSYRAAGAVVIAVNGWLNGASAARLEAPLTEALSQGHPHLVLDLHMLRGLDSDGVAVLWAALRGVLRRGGTLAAAGAPTSLRPALDPLVPHGLRLSGTLHAALDTDPDPQGWS